MVAVAGDGVKRLFIGVHTQVSKRWKVGWLARNHNDHYGGWTLQVAGDRMYLQIPTRRWRHMSSWRWRQTDKLSAMIDVVHAVTTQDSETVYRVCALEVMSTAWTCSATERLFVKVIPSIFMVVTLPGSGGGGWAFFLSIVDEDDLCKFDRIGLEIILPSPLSDVVELSLSAAIVCSRDDVVRVVSELDEFVHRSDCFQICSTDHVRRRS